MDEMDQSPFTQVIIYTIMPTKFYALNFSKFGRTTDPHKHICQYQQVMLRTSMSKELRDAIMCKLFPQSLKGNDIKWLCQLGTSSVLYSRSLPRLS